MPDPSTNQKVVVDRDLAERYVNVERPATGEVDREMTIALRAALSAQDVQEEKRCRCGGDGGWVSSDAQERARNAEAGGHSGAAAGWVECPGCPDCSPEVQEDSSHEIAESTDGSRALFPPSPAGEDQEGEDGWPEVVLGRWSGRGPGSSAPPSTPVGFDVHHPPEVDPLLGKASGSKWESRRYLPAPDGEER